jgi:hypothetical protein
VTFQLVCVGWVLFRATSFSNAFAVFGRLFTGWTQPSPLVNFAVLLVLVVGIGSQYVPKELPLRAQVVFSRLSVFGQGAVLAAVLLVITTLGPPGVAPFIYFRF